jgi:uncharacterized protein
MNLPPTYAPTAHTRVRRLAQRGSYDRALVHAILDEALVCHVGYVHGGQSFVIPTAFVRLEETLYVHGAVANRTLGALLAPSRICVTVTLLDGLVLARSAFHHSMNYRSVVALGQARELVDGAEKRRVLDALVERLAPGRAQAARAPNEKELRATRVLALDLVEVSAKTRSGPPLDDEEDMTHECWAGVVPLKLVAGEPIPDEPASK